MKTYLFCLSFLLGIFLWGGCNKDEEPCMDSTNPDCPNYCFDPQNPSCDGYNPCSLEIPVSADFRIIENGTWGTDVFFDTVYYDTVNSISLITEAIYQEPGYTYTWFIGSGTYEGGSISLDYSNIPKFLPFNITLVVSGPPNVSCFPEDDGRDTVTRTVIFNSGPGFFTDRLLFGHLNGNLEDTITLGIVTSRRRFGEFYNFKRGCIGGSVRGVGSYKSIKFYSSTIQCGYPIGICVRDPDKVGDFNQVRCTYTLRREPGEPTYVFDGRPLE